MTVPRRISFKERKVTMCNGKLCQKKETPKFNVALQSVINPSLHSALGLACVASQYEKRSIFLHRSSFLAFFVSDIVHLQFQACTKLLEHY